MHPQEVYLPLGHSMKDRGSGPCDHCGSKFDAKEKYYYLQLHMRPGGWTRRVRKVKNFYEKPQKPEAQKQFEQ